MDREQVVRLIAAGLNDCAIARETGIPRSTVREWRHALQRPRRSPRRVSDCAVCGGCLAELPQPHYAYLLGLYLGDGHLVLLRRGVYLLRIFCNRLDTRVVQAALHAAARVIPSSRASAYTPPHGGVTIVMSHSKHWPCLLPQHGPGRKHERRIALVDWQEPIITAHPDQLLRGLIHSDGCRGTNRVTVNGRQYVYPRYQFCNASEQIRNIFCDACDALGVPWRQMNRRNISVARREAVAALDAFIEPKR